MTTDTVHPKPTVLRVFPPPPTPRFWHRDGSTAKPTVAGDYGFLPGGRKRGFIIHIVEYAEEDMRRIESTRYEEIYSELPDGQYWGPIVGPWQGE